MVIHGRKRSLEWLQEKIRQLQPVRNNRADSIADMKYFFMGFSLKQMKWALTNYSERVKICAEQLEDSNKNVLNKLYRYCRSCIFLQQWLEMSN